jgi:hypothetical protein
MDALEALLLHLCRANVNRSYIGQYRKILGAEGVCDRKRGTPSKGAEWVLFVYLSDGARQRCARFGVFAVWGTRAYAVF